MNSSRTKRLGRWLALPVALVLVLAGCDPALPPDQSAAKGASPSPATVKSADEKSDSIGGVTKGFKIPDYDKDGKLKSAIFAKEARNLTSDVIPITGLRVETYDKDGKVELIVEAPECTFDRKNKSARSAGKMEARSADGSFSITGEGFEWNQASGKLVLSNRVHTTIDKQFLNQSPKKP